MNDSLKKQLIEFINSKVDIPVLNEEQEEKLLEVLVDLLISLIPALLKMLGFQKSVS